MSGRGPEEGPEEGADAELRARLAHADPATSLPPVEPAHAHRLLEDAMSHDVTETRETGARRRSPLTWAVAAAAAAVIIGVGAFSLLGGDGSGPPTAGPESSPPADASEGTVTELTVPDRAGGRCMVPNAAALSNAAFALDGEVRSIEDGVVTLDVTEWYAGEPTDEVLVRQASGDEAALLAAVQFEEGGRYLVAGSADGDLMVCGFSGRFSRDLARLYASAFDG